MELKNQVVSLELAKKLKKLGVGQDNLFYWIERYDFKSGKYIYQIVFSPLQKDNTKTTSDIYSAFTVAELGEMLLKEESFRMKTTGDEWNIWYDDKVFGGDIEADARANLIIYLIENKLV